ncbi:MAG: IS66 family transposase [Nitrospinaceae bacterium]|jgi:transposase|nr:IS66 family transposase [Nitrospinaceae bacterium]
MIDSLKKANTLIEQKDLQIEELNKKLHSTQLSQKMLQHQVDQLLRRVYGRRSEKLDPNQLMFDDLIMESLDQPAPQPPPELLVVENTEKKKPRTGKRNHPGRIPMPEHLERVNIVLDIPEQEKVCPETGKPLKKIGEEVSQKLEYRPGKLVVNVYRRPKYASPDSIASGHVGVITAPMPDHPIERCKADIGLLSQVIVSKFADHLPLYRQDGIFERERVNIPRATQSSWVIQTYEAIRPLEDALKMAVLSRDVIFTDDSIIPLQVKGNGKVKKARLWVYVRGGPGPPLTVFDFSHDRSKKRPLDFLDGYRGYVHADAYSGYDELFRLDWVIEVACWAHTRRKFDEAASSRPQEATEVLARIAQLYKIESECKEMTPEQRCNVRDQRSRPILDGIFERMEELKTKTLPSEPFRKAIDYALNQRKALFRYLDDGRLKPDNNTSENAIRPLALGRKNWMFTGSERGARATALFLGLIQSCKACEVNPWEYFDDMLRRIMSHPVNRLGELLPDQWKPLPRDERGLIIQAQ